MPKLNKTKADDTESVIVYGAPKSGKTQLVGQLAEHFNLIWIDLEGGHGTLYKMPEAWQARIELINIPDSNAHPMAIETCLKVVKKAVTICAKHGKVDCMICKRSHRDLLSSLEDSGPEQKAQEDSEEKAEEKAELYDSMFTFVDLFNQPKDTIVVFDSSTQLTNSAIANITKAEEDTYKLQTDDWGALSHLMEVFYSQIQSLPIHRIVISHDSLVETESKKKSLVPVAGSSNFSRNVAKYFGHVVYCERKNKKHTFASSSTHANGILTGSRSDVALEDSEVPSLLAIFKPELNKAASATATAKKKATATAPAKKQISTSDLLARLKNKANA